MRRLCKSSENPFFFINWEFLFLLVFAVDEVLDKEFISDFYTHSKRVARDSVLDGVR